MAIQRERETEKERDMRDHRAHSMRWLAFLYRQLNLSLCLFHSNLSFCIVECCHSIIEPAAFFSPFFRHREGKERSPPNPPSAQRSLRDPKRV